MRFWILAPLLALVCSLSFAQGVVPEVDTAEVIRRGDSIEVVGEGPRDHAAMAFFEAMAPPADDSHKWFVTLITQKDCPPCEALKADFRKAPELLAFVAAPDEAKAWAHYTELCSNEKLQQEKIKHYTFKSYPTLVVQPPRNGRWGDPSTVVFQVSGYNGDAKKLAASIRASVAAYSAKFPKDAPKFAVKGFEQPSPPIEKKPDFEMWGDPLPPDPSAPNQIPPASQVGPDANNPLSLLVALVSSLLGGGGNWGILILLLVNTGMYVWDWYRERLKNQGKVPIFTDAQKTEIVAFLNSILGNRNPTPPSNPVP